MGIWFVDMQVVGKDIICFYVIYWLVFLMVFDMLLLKKIFCYLYWIMFGCKMFKFIGNVVDFVLVLECWGIDFL